MTDLSFSTLRKANVLRLPQFKNSKGEKSHSKADGSDWSSAEWMQAVTGELGELCNVLKKVRRGDISLEDAMPMIKNEFADIVTYLDIAAFQFRIDLGDAVAEKFNEVSRRVQSDIFIKADNTILDCENP